MKHKEPIKLFFRFLKNENIYHQYISYCSKNFLKAIDSYELHDLFNHGHKGWGWSCTKEGRTFWRLINLKWLLILMEVGYKYNCNYSKINEMYKYFMTHN